MTDQSNAPGASSLMEGGSAPPPMSVSVEQAWARLNVMRDSPEIQSALARNDPEVTAELKGLLAQTRAPSEIQVSVRPDSTPHARDNVADTWLQFADLPPAVIEQVKNRTVVSIEEVRLATAERRRLMADKEFVKQYLDGHRSARTKLALVNIILSSPVQGAN